MKKQSQQAGRLPQTGVATQTPTKTIASKGNNSVAHNEEGTYDIPTLVAKGVILGVTVSLDAIKKAFIDNNNKMRHQNNVILSLSMFSVAGGLTVYALRKKILSKFRKK